MPTDPISTLHLRQYADGELSDADADRVEAYLRDHPEAARGVAFDKGLREAVSASMRSHTPAAPAILTEQVRAALADEDAAALPMNETRWLVGPRRTNALAIAASLLLITATVLFGIFGRSIDDIPVESDDLIAQAAQFIDNEHMRCVDSPNVRQKKLCFADPKDAAVSLASYLKTPSVAVFDFSGMQYSFIGAGRCALPGHPTSAHLIYKRDDPNRRVAGLSVFMMPDVGQFDSCTPGGMKPGDLYRCRADDPAAHSVFRCTNGRVVYFVICCDERDLENAANHMVSQLNGKEPTLVDEKVP